MSTQDFSKEHEMNVLLPEATQKQWHQELDKRAAGAGIYLEDEQGDLLIVRSDYQSYWTIPGGMVEKGETPKQTALRECGEEIGVYLKEEDISFQSVFSVHSEKFESYSFIYRAQIKRNHPLSLETSEVTEAKFISRDALLDSSESLSFIVRTWAEKKEGYLEAQL